LFDFNNKFEWVCFFFCFKFKSECNLKPCYSKPETREYKTPEQLSSLQGIVKCKKTKINFFQGEKPRFEIEIFNGFLELVGVDKVAFNIKNVLLRGTAIKNTEFVSLNCF
jgi:hypothetical protein